MKYEINYAKNVDHGVHISSVIHTHMHACVLIHILIHTNGVNTISPLLMHCGRIKNFSNK